MSYLKDKLALLRTSPTSVAEKIRQARIEIGTTGRSLNAFIELLPEIETNSWIELNKDKKLFGLTLGIKDSIAISGAPLTFGLADPLVAKSTQDAHIVERFRELGALPLARTNLDEACLSFLGTNRHYGDVVNPLNNDLPVTGSSGGSAAAVAGGLVDCALATDIGGSIRGPASACRLFGLQISSKTFDTSGIMTLAPTLESVGLFLRDIDDLYMIAQEIISKALHSTQLSQIEILVPVDSELEMLSCTCRTAFNSLIDKFSRYCTVKNLNKNLGISKSREIRKKIVSEEVPESIARLGIDLDTLPDQARAIIQLRSKFTHERVLQAIEDRAALAKQLSNLLSGGSLLLLPVFPHPLPKISEFLVGRSKTIREMPHYLALANLCYLSTITFPDPNSDFSFQLHCTSGFELDMLRFVCNYWPDLVSGV